MNIELEVWIVIVSVPGANNESWPVLHMSLESVIRHARDTAQDKSVVKAIESNREGQRVWKGKDLEIGFATVPWTYTVHYKKARIRVEGI